MSFKKQCCYGVLAVLFSLSNFHVSFAAAPAATLRTPPAAATPEINGPSVYGVRPGKPFLYRIPCTGDRPIHFAAKNLPASLKLDSSSGIISGSVPEKAGEYMVTLVASNSTASHHKSTASRQFKIVVGDTIGLTPQMGWNDWYTHYDHITDGDVRAAAKAMIASGMADYGYQYISIDDCWANKPGSHDPALNGPPRAADGAILSNRRFPDMTALTGSIHAAGLKAGIYSSPGPLTCGGFEGSYQHEDADARQFSKWGFDLLKYDWCSYDKVVTGSTLQDQQKPYRLMGGILRGMDRDVALNMCQYGQADVWKWGKDVGGNSWRTTGDLGVEEDTTLPGFYSIGFANAALSDYARPGGWNDPDYILIGQVGDARHIELAATTTKLTPEEQYSYMSMWSLMASPLFFSGDMTKLDAFTLNVLCNAEVIAVDQDALGKQGRVARKTSQEFILAKPLEDGSLAVGLFNLSSTPRTISIPWPEIGLSGRQKVRDIWRQKDLGTFQGSYATTVAPHGVELVKMTAQHRF